MRVIDWIIRAMTGDDVIDAYFVLSDLNDITLTGDEIAENAYYDDYSEQEAHRNRGKHRDIPLGKQVF